MLMIVAGSLVNREASPVVFLPSHIPFAARMYTLQAAPEKPKKEEKPKEKPATEVRVGEWVHANDIYFARSRFSFFQSRSGDDVSVHQ